MLVGARIVCALLGSTFFQIVWRIGSSDSIESGIEGHIAEANLFSDCFARSSHIQIVSKIFFIASAASFCSSPLFAALAL